MIIFTAKKLKLAIKISRKSINKGFFSSVDQTGLLLQAIVFPRIHNQISENDIMYDITQLLCDKSHWHIDSFHLCLFDFTFIYQIYSIINTLFKPTC